MKKIDEIELYFSDKANIINNVKINHAVIFNGERFVKSYINILKANSGNANYLGKFHELNSYYEYCKKHNNM